MTNSQLPCLLCHRKRWISLQGPKHLWLHPQCPDIFQRNIDGFMEEIQTSSKISKKSWHVFNFNTFFFHYSHYSQALPSSTRAPRSGAITGNGSSSRSSSVAQERSAAAQQECAVAQSSSIVVMIPSKTTTAQPATSEETTFASEKYCTWKQKFRKRVRVSQGNVSISIASILFAVKFQGFFTSQTVFRQVGPVDKPINVLLSST